MVTLALSLELTSARFVELSTTNGSLAIQREEKHFFSQAPSSRKIFIEEIKDFLKKVKKRWEIPPSSLHCILSSDFSLLRSVSYKKTPLFLSTAQIIQRDARQFVPLPLEEVTIVYQKIGHQKATPSQTVDYAVLKTDFLETLMSAIQEEGFKIEKISLIPLSLHSLLVSQETVLIQLTHHSLNALCLSSKKKLHWSHFHPLGYFNNNFCEQETGLPLLLFTFLKNEFRFLNIQSFHYPCWIIKTYFSDDKLISLSRFFKKELGISLVEVDPCLLLNPILIESVIKRLFKKIWPAKLVGSHIANTLVSKKQPPKHSVNFLGDRIIPIDQFSAPSMKELHRKKQTLVAIFTLSFLAFLISIPSLFYSYYENKKTTQESYKISIHLQHSQLELNKLLQKEKELTKKEESNKTVKALQAAHDQWPLLINELHNCLPQRGVWITQLTPIIREIKGKQGLTEIAALEINGLYLEGLKGEELIHEYARKLNTSPFFITHDKEESFLSCSKESGMAYAYQFLLQLQLHSPIQL